MAKVGMPYLKLDRKDHFVEKERKDKHSGNTKAVVMEALKERQSSDPDLDRTKTPLNKYYGIESGEELVTMLETSADEYTITDKKGRKRHLRSDANIGFAVICKPDSDYINSLSKERQEQFFDDSYEVMKQMLEKRGLMVDAAVIHYDEVSPHMHVFGHDPEYNMGRKFDLNMREQMNRGYYPVEMRKRGWDVEDLPRNYDPDHAKTLNEEELKAYKATCRANRKKHGQSAKTYKAEKDAQKIMTDAVEKANSIVEEARQQALVIMQAASEKMAAAEEKERMLADQEQKLAARSMEIVRKREKQEQEADKLKKKQDAFADTVRRTNADFDAREDAQNAREAILDERAKKITSDAKQVLKRQMSVSEREKKADEKEKDISEREQELVKAVNAYNKLYEYATKYEKALERKMQKTTDEAERERIAKRRASVNTDEYMRILQEHNAKHQYDGMTL